MGHSYLQKAIRAGYVCSLLVTAAFAQDYDGTLKGQIVDPSGAGVADQTIAISSPKLGFSRTLTTGRNGRFRVQLPPGDYVLNASGDGYTPVRVEHVAVGLGSTIDINVPVTESAIEEIVVFGEAMPLMKTAVGETGLQMSLGEIAQLPVPRDIDSVALLAPGTVPGIEAFTPTGSSTALVSFGGASVAENAYYVDGLNVSEFNKGLGGSSAPFEFYDQVQLKTGAYSAEFGRAAGGVINAVTRRGSNEFEFGIVSYFEPEWGRGKSPDTYDSDGNLIAYGSERRASQTTLDIYAGGPIVRDRLFFFALYEPREYFEESGAEGRITESRSSDAFWGGNLTWNINDYHSLSYTAFTDEQELDHTDFEYDSANRSKGDLIGTGFSDTGGENLIASYSGQLWDRLSVSAVYGVNRNRERTWSTNDRDCPWVWDLLPGAPARYVGCWVNAWVIRWTERRDALRLDLAYSIGDHTLRAGLDREDRESYLLQAVTGDAVAPDLPGGVIYYYFEEPVGTALFNGGVVPDANGDGSPVAIIQRRYLNYGGTFDTVSGSWYLEDVWDLSDSVILSVGLRNERFKNHNSDGHAFFDIEDQWAPRFGLSWSPRGSVDQTITFNWGRFHQPMMAFPVTALGGGWTNVSRMFLYDGVRDPVTEGPINTDGHGAPATEEIGTAYDMSEGAQDTRASLDTSLEPMYQDEWMIGYERRVSENWTLGIRYINRELKSFIEDVLTLPGLAAIDFPGAIDGSQACRWVVTNPGTDITTYCDIDGVLTETLIPAEALGIPPARRTYEAVELVVDKSLSDDWMFHGSYTWSQNKGNIQGMLDTDTGSAAPHYSVLFDDWQHMDGAYGYLPNDRRHKLRLWGLYQVTDRLTVSGVVTAQSGKPINAFGIDHPDGLLLRGVGRPTFYVRNPDGSFTFNPRGSAGRTHWVHQLDVSAIYSFGWGDKGTVELRADVFNLFDADTATEVNEFAEFEPERFMLPTAYQRPRQLRFGVAIRF